MENFDANNGNEENNYDEIDRQFLKEVIIAEVITKRVIGKVMIKYCGNEGAEHDERTRSLRKLLQAVIDYIQNNPRINWKTPNGEGKYQYVVTDDEMGGVELINTSNKVHKPKPPQKPQPNKEPTRNLHTRENDLRIEPREGFTHTVTLMSPTISITMAITLMKRKVE
ncbi:unnamed protein product [Mytilus edulis]|uniref:Uncharacterized protein n=1 Tax=Mytilus edulis TaxID=6550 RepID=A0A8S3VSR5_MYTED|nr:unnamed protein product [Mytilus edulis]